MRQTGVALGEVEYIECGDGTALSSESDGWRIKVRIDSDGPGVATVDLPWAFPLLPKSIQSIPKRGEGVFVFTARVSDDTSQRYYLGPIISQPQYQEFCAYNNGRGNASSLLSSAKTTRPDPLGAISRNKSLTEGAFPELQDVALIGRGQEDIIVKYRGGRDGSDATSEIDLRTGIRMEPATSNVPYIKGNVVFNETDPAYIQVKYKKAGMAGLKEGSGDDVQDKYESPEKRTANGVINIVADKINLISHKDGEQNNNDLGSRKELVNEKKMDEIMSKLHRSVYGDELITLLKLMVQAICEHTHPYSMLPPTVAGTSLEDMQNYNYEKLISPNVRIS